MTDFFTNDDALGQQNIAKVPSCWWRWDDRERLLTDDNGAAVDYGGVYFLAHFGRKPNGPADPLHDRIVYVGEAKSLRRRWRQFERSAKHGKTGHSGGMTYFDYAKQTGWPWDSLHVSAYPVWFEFDLDTDHPHSLTQRYRLFVEQRFLLQLTLKRQGKSGLHLLNAK